MATKTALAFRLRRSELMVCLGLKLHQISLQKNRKSLIYHCFLFVLCPGYVISTYRMYRNLWRLSTHYRDDLCSSPQVS